MTTTRARVLRNNLTPHEVRLWSRLKRLRVEGFHFRRQAPFKGYYLDFVCFNRRLVIELDGPHHSLPEQMEHDAIRDRILARAGFMTLRYPNKAINSNLEGVVLGILAALEGRPPTRPLRGHPPHEGEGEGQ